jgi:fatty acid hydroxylase family protein
MVQANGWGSNIYSARTRALGIPDTPKLGLATPRACRKSPEIVSATSEAGGKAGFFPSSIFLPSATITNSFNRLYSYRSSNMGAFVSVPLTTALAIPLLSSYTTSLNLLFFTLNWYLLLLTHPPLVVELYGLALIRLLFFLLPALFFFAFDVLVPSLSELIKDHGEYALPGRLSRQKRTAIVTWSIINTALGVALTMGVEIVFSRGLRLRSLLSVSKQLPFPWSAVQSVVGGLVLRGGLQYVIHRFILHNPKFWVGREHVRWQHSVPVPFSLVAAYDHPVAYLLHHWVPLYLPAVLFKTHLLPFLVVLMVTSAEELMTYSGYSVLPSAIMVKGMARRIDLHFLTKGKGNFAAFGAVDWVCGTSVGKPVVEDLQKEWDKHNMDDKVQKGADNANNLIDSIGNGVKGLSKKRSGGRKASAAS